MRHSMMALAAPTVTKVTIYFLYQKKNSLFLLPYFFSSYWYASNIKEAPDRVFEIERERSGSKCIHPSSCAWLLAAIATVRRMPAPSFTANTYHPTRFYEVAEKQTGLLLFIH